jgi:hypothetical protein
VCCDSRINVDVDEKNVDYVEWKTISRRACVEIVQDMLPE